MSGADAAKNALESLFNKTKEVVQTAAETTKGYANVAIGKIMPGHEQANQCGTSNVSGNSPTNTTEGETDAATTQSGIQ